MRRAGVVLAVVLIVLPATHLALPAGAVEAQTLSPAITPARIEVDTTIARGATHDLPALAVRNQGDTPMLIQMSTALAESGALDDPRSWIRFSPERFDIQPGEARAVAVTIHVPRSAESRSHTLLLRAGPAPLPPGEGVAIGVSAFVATTLTFTVGAEAIPRSSGIPPHYFFLTGLAIATGVGSYWVMGWLRGFEINIRRRPPDARP